MMTYIIFVALVAGGGASIWYTFQEDLSLAVGVISFIIFATGLLGLLITAADDLKGTGSSSVVYVISGGSSDRTDKAKQQAKAACEGQPAHITDAQDETFLVYTCGSSREQHMIDYTNGDDSSVNQAKAQARKACHGLPATIADAQGQSYLVYTCGSSHYQHRIDYKE